MGQGHFTRLIQRNLNGIWIPDLTLQIGSLLMTNNLKQIYNNDR